MKEGYTGTKANIILFSTHTGTGKMSCTLTTGMGTGHAIMNEASTSNRWHANIEKWGSNPPRDTTRPCTEQFYDNLCAKLCLITDILSIVLIGKTAFV